MQCGSLGFQGLGFQGLGLRVSRKILQLVAMEVVRFRLGQDLRLRAWGSGFRASGPGLGV